MPTFTYTILTPAGERSQGELKAGDLDAAIQSLQAAGNTIISLAAEGEAPARGGDLEARLRLAWKRLRERVPLRNLVFFTRQLATMFAAGMTLERAIQGLAQGEAHPKFQRALEGVGADLHKGQSLSAALARHPGAFDRLYVALVRSGEMGGSLGATLDRLADHLERTEDVRRKVVSALYYPVFVLLFLAASVLVLVLKVAPMFNRVYRSFGAELPAPTKALMAVSEFLIRHAALGFLAALLLAAAAFAFALTDAGRLAIDTLKLRLPVFGTLMLNTTLARFARTLGLLMSSNVPMLDAFGLVGQVVDNVILEKAIAGLRDRVKEGGSMQSALRKHAVFPALLIQLVATGEETGELDGLLLKAAGFYEKQVDALVGRLTSVIEPLLIVLMGVVVGALVIVIYLPIFYLGMAMKRGMK